MMKENKIIPTPSQRMTVIDALRGFALLGVILMHMLDHFGYLFSNVQHQLSPTMWDTVIQWFTDRMIKGKFISIFSFLFGLSFYIQMDRASKKGIDFRGRFLWRMALLFVIGLIGMCFTYVDILTIYAVFGVVLVFLFPLRNWVLMLIVSLLLVGVPSLFLIGFDNIVIGQPAITAISVVSEQLPADNTIESVTFFQTAKENLTIKNSNKLKYQFLYSDVGYLVLALFIFGFIVGRLRFFEQVNIRKKRNVRLFLLFLLATFALLVIIKLIGPQEHVDLLKVRMEGGEVPLIALVMSALNNLSTVSMSGMWAMGFISLYQVEGVRKYLDILTPYGRMGLTNYEIQNVIGAILFSGWGFGSVFGTKGAAVLFVLGLLIYALQVIISQYWVKRFLYGPLEWLWRSGTYLKWQPFKKKQNREKSTVVVE
ncbi:DUF418 domain-containing protein [Proteiniphilum sp.]|uniref:DUF418 domain-containing protein n=1 Tax=Proteiniphilum sp. TaxID=1926877 RepID=UPI002B204C69|nr:DUF418 domain-containing protein [Proteiniphilum sp.]MEA4917158.1 DUF418 domain-containing protein [Proteiniphilum sp.]